MVKITKFIKIGKEDLITNVESDFHKQIFSDIEIFLSNLPNKSSNEVVQKLIFKFLRQRK